jgi:hypothetical protein
MMSIFPATLNNWCIITVSNSEQNWRSKSWRHACTKMAVFWVVALCSLVTALQPRRQPAIFVLTAVRTSNPTCLYEFKLITGYTRSIENALKRGRRKDSRFVTYWRNLILIPCIKIFNDDEKGRTGKYRKALLLHLHTSRPSLHMS